MTVRPESPERCTILPSIAGSGTDGSLSPARWRAAPSSWGMGSPPGSTLGSCDMLILRLPAGNSRAWPVGDEFDERPVGIPEVDAGAGAFCPETLHWPGFNGDAAAIKMRHGLADRSRPFKAKVTVPRLDRQAGDLGRPHSRPMQIELDRAETIGPALAAGNQLGAKHIAIESIGALPVGDVHHAMIEGDGQRHMFNPLLAAAGRARAPSCVSFPSRACRAISCRAPAQARLWRDLCR